MSRSLAALALTAALLPVAPPARAAAPDGPCSSSRYPKAADRLGARIRQALRGRTGTESVAVYDRVRGIRCAVAAGRHYDSASVVKVTILGAMLRRAVEEKRRLTATEKSRARRMITVSDNGAASALWRSTGRARIARFIDRAGMTRTELDPGGRWGLTQITAHDELELLGRLTAPSELLPAKARAYALRLMNEVVPAQRWGTPAGRPPGVTWHVKNGWLPRPGGHWRVHSIGGFDGHGEDYMIVVLTQDTPSMAYGITTIERVARAVHGTLNSSKRPAAPGSHPSRPRETAKGPIPPVT
ncbi:serine hydrolase [Actinomadura sp. WMMA1423]|uniref:serine hydrolase n=1 Tax=Actinomadura sp. WMMA1423 TaxID=2591108 RepID=UPI001146B46A|nr:serine hydrolase [Actinomadura sp. WMMA1423]